MRVWSGRLIAVVMSLGVTLVALELVARGFLDDPLDIPKDGRTFFLRVSEDPNIRYELTPNTAGRAWGTDVVINAGGVRGPDVQPGKSSHFRIVVIGDSITFGNEVPPESAYPAQLQDLLSRLDGRTFEVLNLGVGGYDTLQEVALLERNGLAYHPDLVVLGYCLNDVGELSVNQAYVDGLVSYRHRLMYRSQLVRYLSHRLASRNLLQWTLERNKLDVFVRTYKDRIEPIGEDESALRQLMRSAGTSWPSSWYGEEPRIGRLRHAFRWLGRLARRERFHVVVVIFPWLDWSKDGYPHHVAHEIVRHEAERAGFDVLDLEKRFVEHDVQRLRAKSLLLQRVHPSPEGHHIAARALQEYVQEFVAREVRSDRDERELREFLR